MLDLLVSLISIFAIVMGLTYITDKLLNILD
jgi:hypothetical protein